MMNELVGRCAKFGSPVAFAHWLCGLYPIGWPYKAARGNVRGRADVAILLRWSMRSLHDKPLAGYRATRGQAAGCLRGARQSNPDHEPGRKKRQSAGP